MLDLRRGYQVDQNINRGIKGFSAPRQASHEKLQQLLVTESTVLGQSPALQANDYE